MALVGTCQAKPQQIQASSPYSSVMRLVKKPKGWWWLMNEVTLALPAAILDVLHM